MHQTIDLRYHLGRTELGDAMIAGGNALARQKRDWPFVLSATLALMLAVTGGVALGSLLWVTWLDRSGPSLPWIAGGAVVAFFLVHYAFRRMPQAQASMVFHTSFGTAEQQLSLSAEGVDQRNDHARWQTNWSGVEAVLPMKSGIAIVISGVAMPIPNDAFAGSTHKQQVLDQMQSWHKAARP